MTRTDQFYPIDYKTSDLVKMDILINGDPIDALSALIHRDRSFDFGKKNMRKTQGAYSPPTISNCYSGSYWRKNTGKGEYLRHAKRCYCQMLWRGYQP